MGRHPGRSVQRHAYGLVIHRGVFTFVLGPIPLSCKIGLRLNEQFTKRKNILV